MRGGRTPRSRRPPFAIATRASGRCWRRSSARGCSTTPRSCSSPTTAWRRTIPPCAATGTSRCERPACSSATRATASCTSASNEHAHLSGRVPSDASAHAGADGFADEEGGGGDERADQSHAEAGPARVTAGEHRDRAPHTEQRHDRQERRRDDGGDAAAEEERYDGQEGTGAESEE